jgi:hypothetical protein
MRLPALSFTSSAAALVGLVLAVGVSGCGPSELALQYKSYVDTVDPLLEQENERWDRIVIMIKKRQNDAAMPRYYKYVREEAIPYYTDFRDAVIVLDPQGAQLGDAQANLVLFANARLEFLHLEYNGYDVYTRATQDGGLLEVQSQVQEAEMRRIAYLKAVGADVPDAKFGELHQIIDPFTTRYFQPMQQQMMDPGEVQVRLRSHVIPKLRDLHQRKFKDTDQDRMLRECIGSWLHWHELLEAKCPLLQEVMQAKKKSEEAAKAAEEALTAFRKDLEKVRLQR